MSRMLIRQRHADQLEEVGENEFHEHRESHAEAAKAAQAVAPLAVAAPAVAAQAAISEDEGFASPCDSGKCLCVSDRIVDDALARWSRAPGMKTFDAWDPAYR